MKIEVSNGEILDKISILAIKRGKMTDKEKLKNVYNEYETLMPYFDQIVNTPELGDLYWKLSEVNNKLWVIEDDLRDKERNKEFDNEFIELARAVYFTNDERAKIKKDINLASGSDLVEEKSYQEYQN